MPKLTSNSSAQSQKSVVYNRYSHRDGLLLRQRIYHQGLVIDLRKRKSSTQTTCFGFYAIGTPLYIQFQANSNLSGYGNTIRRHLILGTPCDAIVFTKSHIYSNIINKFTSYYKSYSRVTMFSDYYKIVYLN